MATLEIWSSLLTFAGGTLLTLDALLVGRRIRTERGAQRLQTALKKRKAEKTTTNPSFTLRDENGNPLKTETEVSLWLAKTTLHWAWQGYLLITTGFVLDFISKFRKC
jgi:hypothetical protein